ncbi:MAG: hypothetical protein K5882_12315 [Bacteroidales bacterium]|nr:hypothetical protein [Bacteroidales bacterium]
MLAGFVLLLVRCCKWSHRITLIAMVLGVYLFFSLADTKKPAYPFCLCAAGYHIAILTSHEVPDYLQSDNLSRFHICNRLCQRRKTHSCFCSRISTRQRLICGEKCVSLRGEMMENQK